MFTIDLNHQVLQLGYIVKMLLSALKMSFTFLAGVNGDLTLTLSTQHMIINQANHILYRFEYVLSQGPHYVSTLSQSPHIGVRAVCG